MDIQTSLVTKIELSDLDGIDSIDIILEDHKKSQGEIIIRCHKKTWSSYWGAMGDKTMAEFFLGCDNYYLTKNLFNGETDHFDVGGFENHLKKEVISQRFNSEISEESARELWNDLLFLPFDDVNQYNIDPLMGEFLNELYGEEYYYLNTTLPTLPNPDYEFFIMVIGLVREGLNRHLSNDVI